MTKTVTHNDLIRFIYQETDLLESAIIDEALNANWELKENYNQLLESKNQLPKVVVSAKQSLVNKILTYSRDTAPMEHSM